MATINITQILGSDNISSSRITINDNFSRLANGINKIETFLDTSVTPGASLNIGTLLVKKYTNPDTSELFTCEASARIKGNAVVQKALSTEDLTVTRDVNIKRNVIFEKVIGNTGTFTSQIPSVFSDEIVLSQLNSVVSINPQTLSPSTSVTRAITSVSGLSVLNIDMSTYSGTGGTNCNIVQLPVGTVGQILYVLISGLSSTSTNFEIDTTVNFDGGYTGTNIKFFNVDTIASKKQSLCLYYSASGWRVLSATPGINY